MTFPYPWSREPGGTKLFFPQASSNSYQVYAIPQNATSLSIFCIGGGGGGGAGFSAAAASARGGGGGGGSGGLTRMNVPIWMLGDVLYLFVGAGGAPGVSAGDTVIAVTPANSVAGSTLLRANGGSFGGTGTGAAVGAAGAAGATMLGTAAVYSGLGVFQATAGQVGATGGAVAGAIGSPITWGSSGEPTSGGAGGAGTTSADFNGGLIASGGVGLMPQLNGGAAGSNPGQSGFQLWRPMTFSGGSGGGSSNAGVGGAGGDAALGSGGGGGGGGTTGGTGGRGGNGLIAITALLW